MDYSEICEQHFQQVSIITLQPPKDDAYVKRNYFCKYL
jgi:hypothetical protein